MTVVRHLLCIACLVLGAGLVEVACASGPGNATATFDEPQRHWLEQHPVLRVGVVLQAPYAQYDRRQQQLSGLNVDITNCLAAVLGVQLQWHNYNDPEALLVALQSGVVDFAPGLAQTPAGLRHWLFSDPYLRVSQLLAGLRGGATGVDLEQLDTSEPIAVRQPSAVADYLRTTYPRLPLQGVTQDRQALQAVVLQQSRFAVVDEAQFSRLAHEAEFTELAVVADIGFPQLLRIGSRRDWPMLANVLQQALHVIPARDFDQWRKQWLQPQTPKLSESPGFWENLFILLLVLFFASAAIVIVQRRRLQQTERALSSARADLLLRETAEEALRLTQFSIEQSTVGILWVNWDSRVRYANPAAEQVLGYTRGTLVDRPLSDIEPALNMDRWMARWKNARLNEQVAQSYESQCMRADGSALPVDLSLSFLRSRDAEYLVVYLSDISERRRTVAALQQSEAQLRELSAHLESVREEEKARIAREVHDELGQMLTVLKLETSMCELAHGHLDAGLQERLNSMKRLIAQLFQLVRDVASALRPPILDAGIGSAIEWQARRFEARTQIPCLVRVPEVVSELGDAKAIGLFRILQEALTNVMRHAQAHTVQISLNQSPGELCLTISDDGQGFDARARRGASFGLVGMRERVLMLGGTLELDSEPGEGTSLTVRVPFD
ncbi:transporter substrate-binding domain-containing protein [Pseudomonas sp. dw_358]|uniref:sensor histidine kinase n=1 Tax=Pseudomonas sp. dw_358 TaxID=2720083 RepID=UPI001BD35871|nr:transporter substrate-binding domain-containing protein [Pseudomonas sp. dw_358]